MRRSTLRSPGPFDKAAPHDGPLATIPFFGIEHVRNVLRDWESKTLIIRTPFCTEPGKVWEVIKKLGLAMLEDPDTGLNFWSLRNPKA